MAISRAETSARLKAGRWLTAGAKENGQPVALGVLELSEREPLGSNGLGKSRIEEIEQAKVDARPWELEKIAEALGLPRAWFTEPDLAKLIRLMTEALPQQDDPDAPGLVEVLEVGALRYETNESQPGGQAPVVPKSAGE